MRLIDADALLESVIKNTVGQMRVSINYQEVKDLITNAPTVQREGWVSVPIEPTEEMLNSMNGIGGAYPEDGAKIWQVMIQAAPKDKEQ